MDWDCCVFWIPIELCCKLNLPPPFFFSFNPSWLQLYSKLQIHSKLSTLLKILPSLASLHKGGFGLAWLLYMNILASLPAYVSCQGLSFCPGLLHAIANQPAESDHIVLGYRSSVLAGWHVFMLLGSCALVAIRRGRKRVSCTVSLHHINHNHRLSGTLDSTISPGPALAHCEDR